jgi:hypothetical protein
MRAAARVRPTVVVLLGVLVVVAVAVAGGVGLAAQPRPDFGLGVAPASQSVQQGRPAAYSVTLSGTGGFSGSVAYRVSGLPRGVTATFGPATASLTPKNPSVTTALSVGTSDRSPVGSWTFTVTGTSGSTQRAVSAGLTINHALNGSFGITAAPSSVTIAPDATAVFSVSVARDPGVAGAVDLAPYGLWPAGISPSFSSPSVTNNSSTLQVRASASSRPGTYTLFLVGSSSIGGRKAYQYARVQVVVADSKKPLGISGGKVAGLAPGVGNQPLDLALSNPARRAISVTNLSVIVTGTSAGDACGPENFAVSQYSGPYPLPLRAGATDVPLSSLRIPAAQQPQLMMLNLPINQDACKSVTVDLSYSGSARGE